MSSYNLSPNASSMISNKSIQSSQLHLKHSINNENNNNNNKKLEINNKEKKSKTNSMTQLTNISNTAANLIKNKKTSSIPTTSTPIKSVYKLNKQQCFSFTNGLNSSVVRSTSSFGTEKNQSSRTESPLLNETKFSLVSSQSNFEFTSADRKEDDCLFQIGSRGIYFDFEILFHIIII
jgi:hypothetical protein